MLGHYLSRLVRQFAAEKKEGIKSDLKERIKRGDRFSLTTDEYTKMAKKYANLYIHLPGGETIGIGLIRIQGSLPAERAKDILCKKLEEYGISDERHLVATTKDGASVMQKMGRLFDALSQVCHAHGLHLAGKFNEISCWKNISQEMFGLFCSM